MSYHAEGEFKKQFGSQDFDIPKLISHLYAPGVLNALHLEARNEIQPGQKNPAMNTLESFDLAR